MAREECQRCSPKTLQDWFQRRLGRRPKGTGEEACQVCRICDEILEEPPQIVTEFRASNAI